MPLSFYNFCLWDVPQPIRNSYNRQQFARKLSPKFILSSHSEYFPARKWHSISEWLDSSSLEEDCLLSLVVLTVNTWQLELAKPGELPGGLFTAVCPWFRLSCHLGHFQCAGVMSWLPRGYLSLPARTLCVPVLFLQGYVFTGVATLSVFLTYQVK